VTESTWPLGGPTVYFFYYLKDPAVEAQGGSVFTGLLSGVDGNTKEWRSGRSGLARAGSGGHGRAAFAYPPEKPLLYALTPGPP